MQRFIGGSLFGAIVGLGIGVFIALDSIEYQIRFDEQAAIKAGVAEYRIVEPETGETEFRFIPCNDGRK